MDKQQGALEERDTVFCDALAEFAAGAGHEINNPLAIISGHAQLLLAKCEDAETRRHLAIIVAQVKRAYEMIADVRLYSRPPEPVFTSFDPSELLASTAERFRRAYADWPGSLRCDSFEDSAPGPCEPNDFPPKPVSDPAMLASILDALLKNAVEANPSDAHGTIRLVCRIWESSDGARRLEWIVEDNGPGVSDAVRPHLFSPYYSGRSSGRGLGFGLPRSAAFAVRLGGTLKIEKPVDFETGARFLLTIPYSAEGTTSSAQSASLTPP